MTSLEHLLLNIPRAGLHLEDSSRENAVGVLMLRSATSNHQPPHIIGMSCPEFLQAVGLLLGAFMPVLGGQDLFGLAGFRVCSGQVVVAVLHTGYLSSVVPPELAQFVHLLRQLNGRILQNGAGNAVGIRVVVLGYPHVHPGTAWCSIRWWQRRGPGTSSPAHPQDAG